MIDVLEDSAALVKDNKGTPSIPASGWTSFEGAVMSDLSSRQVRWFALLLTLTLIPATYLSSVGGKLTIGPSTEEIAER